MAIRRESHGPGNPRYPRRTFLTKALKACAAATPILPMNVTTAQQAQTLPGKNRLRWQAHEVARIPHGYQVAVADVNGDGRPDILALSSVESVVEWYENPSWKAYRITNATKKNISLAPRRSQTRNRGEPDGFGLALATDFALEESTSGGNLWWADVANAWRLILIGQIPTSHRLRWADINVDGQQELIDAPLLGYGAFAPDYNVGAPLTWYEFPSAADLTPAHASRKEPPPWKSHLIDNSLTVVHGLNVLDWDGDGRDEILTASFEGVHLFHSAGVGNDLRWTKTHLAAGEQEARPSAQGSRRGSSEIAVGRIGGRRFLATIEPWHGEEVAVYFEREPGKLWDRRIIDSSFKEGHALACADLDGDGDSEIVAGYRGTGTSLYVYHPSGHSGESWEPQTLDTEMAASGVVIADINGDGRLDVVAIGASTGNVKWYENLGTGG